MGWQPIETAPKDGSEILVSLTHSLGDDEWENVRWVDTYFDGGWFWYRNRIDIPFPPTHWIPLPTPPEQQGPPQYKVANKP